MIPSRFIQTLDFLWICLHILAALVSTGKSSALLSANIRTLQSAACETEELLIKCPPSTAIHVQFANYGRLVSSRERPCHNAAPMASRSNVSIFHSSYDIDEESKDCMASGSKEKVASMCQDKKSCRIPVNVETFKEDPCPKTWKYLEVAYKCKPNVFHNQVVCEGEQMTLECDQISHRLAIHSAMFGRDKSDGAAICPPTIGARQRNVNSRSNTADCVSSYATEMVMQRCQNERSCVLQADEATFGNQCPTGIRKFLSVSYACVPRKILISPTSSRKGDKDVNEEDQDDLLENSIDYATKSGKDMQAIQPQYDSGQKAGITNRFGKKTIGASSSSPDSGDNLIFNMIIDWLFAAQMVSKHKESCILYGSLAVGAGILIFLIALIIHLLLKRRAQRRRSSTFTTLSSAANSKQQNGKLKELRTPLYKTNFTEDNEELESLQPVDLTRFRTTLPRATSGATTDIRRSTIESRSMHRITADGNFYA